MPTEPEPEPEQNAEVEHLFALVRERYGSRLTPAQLDEVKKGVAAVVAAGRALRAAPVRSSDEPFQPFVPYRSHS